MKKHAKVLRILMVLAAAVLFFAVLAVVGICSPFQCSLQPVGCDRWYFCISRPVDMVSAETDLSLCRRNM